MVGGGSEENINICNCWLFAAKRGWQHELIIHNKWGTCGQRARKCMYLQISTDSTFVKMLYFAICSLISTQSLWPRSICAGEESDGVVLISQGTWRPSPCPSFSVATSSCTRQRWSCLSLPVAWHSVPAPVWLCDVLQVGAVFGNTVPETDKTKQYRMLHCSRVWRNVCSIALYLRFHSLIR